MIQTEDTERRVIAKIHMTVTSVGTHSESKGEVAFHGNEWDKIDVLRHVINALELDMCTAVAMLATIIKIKSERR